MAKIINRYSKNLICEDALLDLKQITEKNKANLRGADLRRANLQGANLQGANLQEANLQEANLQGANLWGADLCRANLWGANLQEANLQEANLCKASLWGVKIANRTIINYKELDCIGNSRRQLRCFMLDDESFYFMAGCFSGREEELKEKVLEKYGKNCEYMEAIKFLKKISKKYITNF